MYYHTGSFYNMSGRSENKHLVELGIRGFSKLKLACDVNSSAVNFTQGVIQGIEKMESHGS